MNGRAPATRRTPQEGEAEIRFAPDSIQARLIELRREIPSEEWAKVPRDGSRNLDHYLYGAPRQA
jgi:hypothetical protein